MNTIEIQNKIKELFESKSFVAINEWDVAKNATDEYTRSLYSPRVDLAIGPFNINGDIENNNSSINRFILDNSILITKIKEKGYYFENFDENKNPRCTIAIEIESSGSRKHMLGDIANASILGKIGLVVPTSIKKYQQFVKIMEFLKFAQSNKKINEVIFNNVIIIKSDDLIEILENNISTK